jgi:ABC-type Fe3+-hydroxamate transport system substrate-binding protein
MGFLFFRVFPRTRRFAPRRPGAFAASRLRIAAAALLVVVAGCSAPPDWEGGEIGEPAAEPVDLVATGLEVVDDAGRTVRLARPARRVVALLPAMTETILELGAGDRLVARTDYDDDPRVRELPSVGGGLTPSLEVLAALRPDLVIAWEEAGTARVRPQLEALGIAVFAARTQDTTDILANVQRLGVLLARDAAADSLTGAIRDGLDRVRASVAGRPTPSVLYVVGVEPPLTAGPNTFISQAIAVAGGRTIFPDLRSDWPQLSFEEVVRRRPEVLILPVGARPEAAVARLRATAGWRELLADGRTRVRTVPADTLNRPGPSIVRAAELLRDALHGPDEPPATP